MYNHYIYVKLIKLLTSNNHTKLLLFNAGPDLNLKGPRAKIFLGLEWPIIKIAYLKVMYYFTNIKLSIRLILCV